jgi:hypothetical protein
VVLLFICAFFLNYLFISSFSCSLHFLPSLFPTLFIVFVVVVV